MPSYSQYKRQMAAMDADDANIETWITVKGNHIPIMKGQSKEEAVQSFLEKKGKSSGGAKTVMKPDVEKPGSTTVVSKGSGKAKYKVGDVTKQGKIKEVIPARLSDTPYYKLENGKTYLEEELHAEKPAKPDKNADVSDLVSSYKKQMKELGPNASIKKIDRVQANAIKEFMGRKLGPGRKYDDYYNYWLNGMSKKDSDIFEQIYTESEARERAFSELSGGKYWAEDPNFMKEMSKGKKTTEKPAKSKMPKIDEKADVSDIIKQYKADMKELGENASLAKRDKVEVNAIKEFMRRKVGAGHPYNDYYDYWLRGMSDKDKESFNSIYGESVNREKAFEALSKEKEKPANKGWQNARSSHPETIGKVVRRVVKKMGEARNKNNG